MIKINKSYFSDKIDIYYLILIDGRWGCGKKYSSKKKYR